MHKLIAECFKVLGHQVKFGDETRIPTSADVTNITQAAKTALVDKPIGSAYTSSGLMVVKTEGSKFAVFIYAWEE